MTTKVIIACPDKSPWSVDVSIEDQVFSFETQKHTDQWRVVETGTLRPTESREVYIHGRRRIVIVEAGAPA